MRDLQLLRIVLRRNGRLGVRRVRPAAVAGNPALAVYREESSPFQLTCSPAEAGIGQVRSSNLAIAAMMAYEGVQPRGRFVKMADDDVRDVAVGAVSTRDGRTLAYLEVGDPQGPLVIHNHGGPSSRFEARLLAEAASKNRLRLVCVERPGMGQSSRQKTRSYSGWANDMVTTANALGYRAFGVTGWSEGGPWALAAAAYIDPARLRHISSIAGGSYGTFGNNWAAQYLSKIDAFGGALALRFRPGFRLMYASLGFTAEYFRNSFVKQLRKSVNDYDRQILLRPQVATTFGDACAECFAHGSDGLVRDAELLYRSWAFDVSTIDRRVHMWQGLDDRLVPDPINKAVADRMPGSVWHPVEGAGHFVAVGSGDDIFAIAAEELGAP